MADQAVQSTTGSFGDTLANGFAKVKSTISQLFAKLDLSVSKLIEMVAYFGVGFLAGFLVKKYGGYLLISLVVLVITLAVLHTTGIATLNWHQIEQIFGITPQASLETVANDLTAWFKNHIASVISGVLGFFLGYRVG